MGRISNRQAICEVLLEAAKEDQDIVVACSDSRGSASLAPFAKEFPEQFVELGIAEQNLVAVSAGLAACGKKVFAASPASFLSTRSYEQAKVDVAYSGTNVTLVGISGGVSYGALGMTHHSCQDIAAFCALPDMRVYLPSDRFQTKKLIQALLKDQKPAYVRVSRSASEDVYDEDLELSLNQAKVLEQGSDLTIIDMYCLKPLDEAAVLEAARGSKCILTVEEHSPYGGLGSMVAQVVGAGCPRRVVNMALPDGHLIAGSGPEVFREYGLTGEGIAARAREVLAQEAGRDGA